MKNKLLLLLLSLSITASAQSLEFNAGAQLNSFYRVTNYLTIPFYTPKVGYSINVGIDDVYLNRIRLRFTLGLNTYGGQLNTGWNDPPFSKYSIDGQIDKTVIQLGFYPLNFKVKERLNINIGPQFSMLIHEKVEVRFDERLVFIDPNVIAEEIIVIESSGNLNERHDSYNAKYYVGANIRVAYDIPLSEKYSLVPQYSFYTTISNEFTEFPKATKSMHNMLGIGIKRKL